MEEEDDEEEEEEEGAEEEGASCLASPTLEGDLGRQHEDDEVVGWCGGSDSGGGGGSGGCCCAWAETTVEELFALFSLAESLQAQWHWQDSSCLMMMTGRLRPICWTELPGFPPTGMAVVKKTFSTFGAP